MPTKRNTHKPPRKTASKKTPRSGRPKEPQVPARRENPNGPGACAKPRKTDTIDPGDLQSLPDELRCRVDQAIVERPKALKSVRKLYDHFALKDQGITYKSFSGYVRRARWRSRLAVTGQVVAAMFGSSERDEADRLCNRAYLSLMSTVVHTLQEKVQIFPSEELARLSKIITEQRAVGVKERDVELKTAKQTDSAGGSDKSKPPDTGLPDNFDEIVRRIYGVEVKDEVQRTKRGVVSCESSVVSG